MLKVGCWNIRGLNSSLKQHEVSAFIREHGLACFGLIETKVKESCNKDKILRSLAPGWKFLCNYTSDSSGCIWVIWNPHLLHLELIGESSQSLHCSLKGQDVNTMFYISFIYGANTVVDRRCLWADLVSHNSFVGAQPWLILGDFNAVRFPSERTGGSLDWLPYMDECNDAILSAGLDDLRCCGLLYSWRKGKSGTMRKLDRVLVNGGWMTDFPHSFAEFHPFGVSDHTPIVVHVGVGSSVGKKSFKFFNYWADFDEFLPSVEKGLEH